MLLKKLRDVLQERKGTRLNYFKEFFNYIKQFSWSIFLYLCLSQSIFDYLGLSPCILVHLRFLSISKLYQTIFLVYLTLSQFISVYSGLSWSISVYLGLSLTILDYLGRAGKRGAARQQCCQKPKNRTISGRRILVKYIIFVIFLTDND